MTTSGSQSLFQSQIGRRSLGLFLVCALVPTSVLAWVFYQQAREQLLVQTLSHLQQESKSQGTMLYSRLVTLTTNLDRVAAELPQDGPVTETLTIPTEAHTNLDRRFQELRILTLEPDQPGLTPPQLSHLQEGKSLLKIHSVSGHRPQLTLTRLVNPHRREAGLLSAQLDDTALWSAQGENALPPGTDLVVEDGTGQPIYSTLQPPVTLPDFRRQDSGISAGTPPIWNMGGQDYVAGTWSMSLQHVFLVDPWVIVLSQTRESAMQPIEQFRYTFLLIITLTLCAVMWLSLSQTRHRLEPLLQLSEGIARLASGNFSTQVTVHHHDEFQELADSFNRMAEHLGQQLHTEEILSSMGKALLSNREPTAMAGVVLSRVPQMIRCDAAALVLLDRDDASPTELFMQFFSEPSDDLTTAHCQVTDKDRETLITNQDHTLVTLSSLPSFLTPMRRPNLSVFALLSMRATDQVRGVFVLAYREKKRPPVDDLITARRVADLIAAALPGGRTIDIQVQPSLDLVRTEDVSQPAETQSSPLQPTNQSLDAQAERLRSQQSTLLSLLQDHRVCENSLPVLAQQVTTIVAQALSVQFVSLWVHEETTESLNCLDRYNKTNDQHTDGRKLLHKHYPNYMAALDRGPLIAATHTLQESAFQDFPPEIPTSVQIGARLDAPFHTQGKLAGVISIEHVGSPHEWTSDEQQFARAIANVITLVLNASGRRESHAPLGNSPPTVTDATQVQTEFPSNMNHEIRTPLSDVIGMAEILTHTPLTDTQRQYVHTIHKSGTTLLTLLSNILDGQRLTTSRLEVYPVPIDLRDLVESIVEQWAEHAQRKGLQIQAVYDPAVPTTVLSDPLRLTQLVTSLLRHAITFTQAGEVTVSVTQEPDPSGQEGIPRIKLAVVDTGPGISLEEQPNLFQSRSQEDTFSTQVPGDTELNLSRCKQLSELMGGTIGVESVIGKGSTFWIMLPFPLQSDLPAQDKPDSSFGNLCLCAAIGSASTRALLNEYLSSWDISPHMADSEGEFLEHIMTGLATERGPVVALIDEYFDNLTATQIIQTLLSDPILQSVKVIRLVSLIKQAEVAQDTSSTHRHHVTKPLRFHALHQALVDALADQSLATQHAQPAPPAPTLSGHILLGEDNPVNQEIALLMLEGMGCTVTVAQNGREVVEHAQQSHYDVILMDCQMPEMDGFEATTRIREWERHESRAPIPIIALTAHATAGDREECLAIGMSDYVSKPFTMAQLHAVLTSWLPLSPKSETQESRFSCQSSIITSLAIATTPAPEPDSSFIVDQNAWKSITSLQRPGKPDGLAKILSLYLADSHNLVSALQQGMANGDAQAVNHAAHSLRSRSAMLGAVSLSKLCRQLEELSRQGQLTEGEPLLAPLSEAFDHANQIFQDELERRPT